MIFSESMLTIIFLGGILMQQCFKRSTAWLLSLALILGLFAGVPGLAAKKASAAAAVENNMILNPGFEDYAIPGWTIT